MICSSFPADIFFFPRCFFAHGRSSCERPSLVLKSHHAGLVGRTHGPCVPTCSQMAINNLRLAFQSQPFCTLKWVRLKCRLQAIDFQLNACRDVRPVRPLTFQLTVDEYTGEQVDCCVACRDARLVRPP